MAMLTILAHRERIETVSYTLNFDRKDQPGSGYGLPCDKAGNLIGDNFGTKESREAQAAQLRASGEYHAPYVQDYHNSYVEPASGRCKCGSVVCLSDGLENYCEGCDACYNLCGQRVYPELTEERYEDDY